MGIEAAARHYFGKSAQELTLGEAALLSGIPQSPSRFNPRKHLEAALQRREYVLERMKQLGMAGTKEFDAALVEKIQIKNESANAAAPHFADYVIQRTKNRGGIVRTTLDPAIQAMTDNVIAQKYRELSESGIDGLAAVVLDTKDSSLLAMIGNANPGSAAFGDVNGATSKRQPGSLLKPFLFCSAYELGLLTPDSVVYDVPTGWKEYRPENMDRDYMGAISAAEALRNSRNIPAVKILQQIGLQRFSDKLDNIGLKTPGAVDQYSLSLALGTAEMSLLDLTNAYAMLAREGQYRPLKILAEDGSVEAVPVYTPQSAWLTIQSLPANHDGTLVWKTGTSWNYRDAWAICISPRYVVGIWCGNFAGNGNNRLVGARSALPVALELADSLTPQHTDGWHKPQGVATRRVCALSGCAPAASCTHMKTAPYIPSVSSESICTLHRVVNSGNTAQENIAWPADVAAFLDKESKVDMQIRQASLKLLSPVADAVYFVPHNKAAESKRLDLSSVSSDEDSISYFIDGEYVGREESGKALGWTMVPGTHTVIAATTGGSARVDFVVKNLDE